MLSARPGLHVDLVSSGDERARIGRSPAGSPGGGCGLPLQRTKEALSDPLGVPGSERTLTIVIKRAACILIPVEEHLEAALSQALVIRLDASGLSMCGASACMLPLDPFPDPLAGPPLAWLSTQLHFPTRARWISPVGWLRPPPGSLPRSAWLPIMGGLGSCNGMMGQKRDAASLALLCARDRHWISAKRRSLSKRSRIL